MSSLPDEQPHFLAAGTVKNYEAQQRYQQQTNQQRHVNMQFTENPLG
jgi:hypothetical protein